MPESSGPVSAGGRSGESCRQPGPYKSDGAIPLVVFFRSGERFPNDAEAKAVRWTLLREDPEKDVTQ